MYEINEINILLQDRQQTADMLGLEIDVFRCYQAFYEQHRQLNGSMKIYLNKPEYFNKMQERYEWCIDSIDCLIEARQNIKNHI